MAIISKGGTWRHEVPLLRSDGKKIAVDMSVQLVSDEKGNPLTLMSSIIDITERKHAEDELREAESKYRDLVQNSNDLIYRIDLLPVRRFTYVNPVSVRMTGYSPEEHYADPDLGYKMVHPDDRPKLERMMKEGMFYIPVQLRWVRKDGTVVWTEQHNVPTYDSEGRLIRIEGVARDISERKNIEEALKRNEEMYRSTLTHAGMGIGLYSMDGRVLFVNSLAAEIMEEKSDMVEGKAVEEVFGEAAGKEYRDRISRAAASPDVLTFEDRRCAGGSERWLVSIFSKVLDPEGNVAGIHVISHDITERKKMEMALRSANRKLNLLSGLTRHDLTNQLMVQMSSMTLSSAKRETSDPDLERAIEAGKRIEKIIGFTKDYEEMGANAPRWHNLTSLLEGVMSNYRGRMDFRMEVPEGLEIFTDELISKVFVNLAENALMHGEHVTRIRSWTRKEGDSLHIFFADDGVGIPERMKTRIFERGFGRNTGQGLFLTREVLDLTGMSIDEVGESGKGAVFRITVPPTSYRFACS
jgi:PAS domain S-box-containing protein